MGNNVCPCTNLPYVSTSEDRDRSQHSSGTSKLAALKLNDGVYQVYPPKGTAAGAPRVEIVFFHGVTRLEQAAQSYITTWTTPDGRVCWPEVWLPTHFSDPAIYMVSYDSCAWTNGTHGMSDRYLAGESILKDLLLANIGQRSRCPLILVGHDLGGLVIKQVCMLAQAEQKYLPRTRKADLFLKQIRGVFFLATPHAGLPLKTLAEGKPSKIYESLKELDNETSRLNADFRRLKEQLSLTSFSVHASHAPQADQLNSSSEASARLDADNFVAIETDSDRITRPEDEDSGCYPHLRGFIGDILRDFRVNLKPKLPFSIDSSYVPLTETISRVLCLLREKNVVLLYGEPGTGKSSLAKHLAIQFHQQNEHDSVFPQGCYFVECDYGGVENAVQIQHRLLAQLLGVDKAQKYLSLIDPAILHQKLSECLEHLDALIILDNVEDYELVKQLVVSGKKVKYLVTVQESAACKGDKEIHICKMQDIHFRYGKQILASKVGFPHHIIPDDLQVIIAEILEATDCNPLALATLSTAVREECKSSPQEWSDIKEQVHKYLDRERSQKGSRSKASEWKYPRGFYASMMYAVQRLGREELTLLSIISLFEGPSIPFRLLKLFVRSIRPGWENDVYMLLKGLTDRNIVQMRDVREEVRDFSVSIHPLRQYFILQTLEEPLTFIHERIKSCLRNGAHYDSPDQHHTLVDIRLVHAFCKLYGTGYTKKLVDDRDILPFMTLDALRDCLHPFLRFLDHPGKHMMVRQIFEDLVIKGELHTSSVLELFENLEHGRFISRSLVNLFLAIDPKKSSGLYLRAFEYSLYSILNLFIVHKSPGESLDMLRGFIGSITCSMRSKFNSANGKTDLPTLSEDLDPEFEDAFGPIDDSLWEAVQSSANDVGCEIAGNLVIANASSSPCIRLIPGAAETLVGKICSNEEKEAQFQALALFTFLAIANGHRYSLVSDIPGAVDALLGVLCGSEERELSRVSEEGSTSLVILSEFLALLVLQDELENGIPESACLRRLTTSKYSKVLTALARTAVDSHRTALRSFALEIIARLLLVQWFNANHTSFDISPECLDQFDTFYRNLIYSSSVGKALAVLYFGCSSGSERAGVVNVAAVLGLVKHVEHVNRSLGRCFEDSSRLCSFLLSCEDSLVACALIILLTVEGEERKMYTISEEKRMKMTEMWCIIARIAKMFPRRSGQTLGESLIFHILKTVGELEAVPHGMWITEMWFVREEYWKIRGRRRAMPWVRLKSGCGLAHWKGFDEEFEVM